MSVETYGWLILLFPLGGTVLIGLGWRAAAVARAGWIGTLAIAARSSARDPRADRAPGPRRGGAPGRRGRVGLREDGRRRRRAVAADRPAERLHGAGGLGVSMLIHLYSVAYMASDRGYARFFAYLNFFVFSMLLLVLAGNFLILIIGWAFVGAASYLLISFWYRRTTATQAGIKAFVINVVGDVGLVLGTYFIFKRIGTLDFLTAFERGRRGVRPQRRRPRRRLPAAAGRRVRQVRPGPAAHLAPGRDGGPDAGLRADPRRHDGHRRRLPDRAHAPAVRAGAGRRRRRRDRRLRDAADRGHDRPRRHRPQARHRVLDDVADRLHGHGRLERGLRRRACST